MNMQFCDLADDLPSVAIGEDFPDLRDGVRRLCAGFPGEYWRKNEEAAGYPTAFVNALTQASYLSALIPEEYGGAGLPVRAAGVILEEINAAGCTASQCHAQMYIMGTLLRHGSAAHKAEYLPKIAAGALRLQAFGVTEPGSGSDTTKLRTRAVRDGDDYVITGQKVWTSRALHSDLMLLLVRTTPRDEILKKTDGLSVLLVDLQASKGKGIEIRRLKAMVNHNTTEIFFDGLRVPLKNLIGEEGKGFRYILDGMNAERILVAAEAIGDGRWMIEKATAYAKERVVFDRPIGQNQGVQFPIARAYASLQAADMMVRKAAALFDAKRECGADANMAKLLAADAAWEAAEAAMQTFGGFAYATAYDIERKWREIRVGRTAPISVNLILAYIGQHVLGMPRSY